jgi:5-hydroxyisourate hydrolase-like protein (transthyretin family)
MNQKDGSLVWTWTFDPLYPGGYHWGRVCSSIAFFDGVVFFGADFYWDYWYDWWYRTAFFALNASDGREIWSTDIHFTQRGESGPIVYSSASVTNDMVFIGADDNYLYCLDTHTGIILWSFQTNGCVRSTPSLYDSMVFFGSDDHEIYCLTLAGTILWNYSTGGAIRSSPAIADGKVYVGSEDGYLYVLDITNGNLLDKFYIGGQIESSPAIADEKVFVGSTDGRLYALFSTGRIPTTLSDPSVSTTFSHSTSISTRLTDENGTGIPDALIFFSLYYNDTWNSIGGQLTNSEGNATITYDANLPAGLYDLRVYFRGNFYYDSTFFVGKLVIDKEPTSLAFEASPIEVNYNDVVSILTSLKDDENNPIYDATIQYQIFVDGAWINIGSNITSTEGEAYITYLASLTPETYHMKAFFEGNSYYENSTMQATLIIHKEITQISDPSTVATYNDVTLIQSRLEDDECAPVSGVNVTFWIYYNDRWNQIGSTMTNINGYARIDFFVTLEPGIYSLITRFNGNDFYLDCEYIGTLSVYSKLIIDNAFSSKERTDVGAVQFVYFHVKWQYNDTSVNGGIIYINSTRLTINATGWAELAVTSPKAGLHTWNVASIDCNGATVFTQTTSNPYIIWDEIAITLSVQSSRVDVGTEITINISATYAYDRQPFSGPATLNDTVFKLSSIGEKSYTVTQVNDPIYGLTTFKSNIITVIWDKIEVILQTTKSRINVGESAPVTINAFYAYDSQPFIGTIILNDTSLVSTIVTKKGYTVTNVIDHIYNVSSFTTNTVSVIWDKVEVTISTELMRVDIGKNISLTFRASYSYDQQPFIGTISLNDTSTVAYSPTLKAYTVAQISDQLYGLTSYSSNSISVIWDEVNITIHVKKQRIKVGESANITIEAKYSYDNQKFSGQIILNDTTFSLSFVGRKSFTTASIVDNDYGLTRFSSNTIYVIWDNIQTEYSISNTSPGFVEILVKLFWEYDGTPVTNADMTGGSAKATYKGNGTYLLKMSNWNPILSFELIISTDDSQPLRFPIEGILLQNFLIELVFLPATLVSASGVIAYRWRKKRHAILKALKDLDPRILEVAKNYGGILTRSVVAYELKVSLEIAKECLERFVKAGEAQKITKANLDVYDFASARTHLSKVDNRIIILLRDNFRGLPKHELLETTGLTLEPLEESLERLERSDIIAFDKTTREYRLKGLVMGKIRCPNCKELVDVTYGRCSKCGAQI